MIECSELFELPRKCSKRVPILEKRGVVHIHFNGKFDSFQISRLLSDIHFVICTYKKACKKIIFVCDGVFRPKDMFVYVLFETFIYTLRCKYGYEVTYQISTANSHVHAPGIRDSLLVHFYNDSFDIGEMEKNYCKIHNKNHFRRIIPKEDIAGAAILLGELKLFFSLFDFDKDYGLKLARVVSELVDNASEHAEADCLVDIYVSDPTYKKKDCEDDYYAISMVVFNLSSKPLNYGVKNKILNEEYRDSNRYDLVKMAYENHKKEFKKNRYEEDDFFNIASFQDRISGRKNETKTGGTGLTDLIKSLEDRAEVHSCYVLSGNKGLWFEPEYLKYNSDNWIGFNETNDFLSCSPDLDLIVRSKVDFIGTGYNFAFVVKKEDFKND